MRDLAIIIPSRLAAVRFPNKPLMKINNKEMILHVHQTAIKSDVGEVYVVSPDEEILKLIKQNGGNAIKSLKSHRSYKELKSKGWKVDYLSNTIFQD